MLKYNRVVVVIICGLDAMGVCIGTQITQGLSFLTGNTSLQKKISSDASKSLNCVQGTVFQESMYYRAWRRE